MIELLKKMTEEDRAILIKNPEKYDELAAKYSKKEPDEPEFDDKMDAKTKEYIKQLREEAKSYRLKMKEHEEALKKTSAEAEEKKRAELEKTQQYEKLYNELKEQLKDYETLKGEIENYRTKEQKEKETLIKKLPANVRDMFLDAKVEQIRAVLELQGKAVASPGAEVSNGQGQPSDPKKMNYEELTRLAETNYPAYEKIILGK